MRISELARRAGVTVKAVRHYESLRLITPARLPNGYRDFCDNDVRLVREIRLLSQLGIRGEKTRPFLDCLARGSAQADDCPSSLAGYRDAIDELTASIDVMAARREALIQRLQTAAYRDSCAREEATVDLYRQPDDSARPADDGAADHLIGLKMPKITLLGTHGDRVRLHDLGPGRSIIYLYPLTGRPDIDLPDGWNTIPGARGCTAEACNFRDHHSELAAVGAARVFGLSSQASEYQQEVVERLGLPFAMLSDTSLELAAALRLPTFHAAEKHLYRRVTLIIDHGVIEHAFYPVFPPDRHAAQVLHWLRDHPV